MNLYAYAGNNPIQYRDPFGLCPQYLTGRPCLNPLLDAPGSPSLRPDGKGAWHSQRIGGKPHRGADLDAPLHSRVGAADAGRVVRVGEDSISGNYVIIEHTNADGKAVSWTAYMHLSKTLVEDGAELSAGDQIGLSGDTGNAKGEPPHLHFEIRTGRFGPPIDPMPAFNKPVD